MKPHNTLGERNLMCFICETQWPDPEFSLARRLWGWLKGVVWPEKLDGIAGWRSVVFPHCLLVLHFSTPHVFLFAAAQSRESHTTTTTRRRRR